MRKVIFSGLLLLCVCAATASARGRVGAGYLVGGTTRWDAMGKQSYISHGPLVYARWSVDLSYYLDFHPVSGLPAGEIFNEEYITVPLNLNFIISTADMGALRFLDYVGVYAGPRLDWCIFSHNGSDRTFSFIKQDYGYRPLNLVAGLGIYVIKGKWSFTLTADHGFLDRCAKADVKIKNDWFVSFRIGFEFGR